MKVAFRADLRPAVTFVSGLPHGETNQDGFQLGGRQNERYGVDRTAYFGVLAVAVLHD
jgi:hypothetical protein